MIEVEHLTKRFGPKVAVKDVSFNVKKGEILGFLGPNGAGKTTTMRILAGFMPATSGSARIAGFDVLNDSLEVRKRIGYMLESVPLYPEMTVKSYLDFQSKIKGVPRKLRKARIADVVEKARLNDVYNTIIGKLSKGYRQRVGLAQALVADPPVLILDEPTIGLDPKQVADSRNVIRSLGGEHTVILSSHMLSEVSLVCSRVVIINQGEVMVEDTPANLTAQLKGFERLELEVRGPEKDVVQALQAIPGVMRVKLEQEHLFSVEYKVGSDPREAIASAVVKSGWGLGQMRSMPMSLEDIFLKVVAKKESA